MRKKRFFELRKIILRRKKKAKTAAIPDQMRISETVFKEMQHFLTLNMYFSENFKGNTPTTERTLEAVQEETLHTHHSDPSERMITGSHDVSSSTV